MFSARQHSPAHQRLVTATRRDVLPFCIRYSTYVRYSVPHRLRFRTIYPTVLLDHIQCCSPKEVHRYNFLPTTTSASQGKLGLIKSCTAFAVKHEISGACASHTRRLVGMFATVFESIQYGFLLQPPPRSHCADIVLGGHTRCGLDRNTNGVIPGIARLTLLSYGRGHHTYPSTRLDWPFMLRLD